MDYTVVLTELLRICINVKSMTDEYDEIRKQPELLLTVPTKVTSSNC